MRVTVFGASGLLGQALVHQWKNHQFKNQELQNDQLTALSSRDADLRSPSDVQRATRASRPDWIILCAAFTDVDGCESNRDLAFALNCDGAVNVARAALDSQSRLMFLSTDYVFDGSKTSPYETSDPRNPINVYGESKARAEERLLEIMPEVCIVRTSWLFGPGGKCFPATIRRVAATASELPVVNDQRGSPTLTTDLASSLLQLCRKSARGIVHATNSGDCTWFDLAREIVRLSGLATVVRPVSSAEFPRPARRPIYSVLSPASFHAYGIRMPVWKDALQRYLAQSPVASVPPAP